MLQLELQRYEVWLQEHVFFTVRFNSELISSSTCSKYKYKCVFLIYILNMHNLSKIVNSILLYTVNSPCGDPAIMDFRYYGQNPDPYL